MKIPNNISENLRFLVSELNLQLSHLQTYLETAALHVAKHILDRSGYTYNLRIRIQNACIETLQNKKQAFFLTHKLKALETIALDLEHLSELCRYCVSDVQSTKYRPKQYKCYSKMLTLIIENISKIEISIKENNTSLALEIGNTHKKFRKKNKKLQKTFIRTFQKKHSAKDLLLWISVLNNLNAMGKTLKHISEAVISANLGQNINTERYYTMKTSLEQWSGMSVDKIKVEQVAQTRSGSNISGVSTLMNQSGYDAIFKEGKPKKLQEEKQSVESWHQIYPGLAPKIIDYHHKGKSASILIEHLSGQTYEKILLHGSDKHLNQTCNSLYKLLKKVWNTTYDKQGIFAAHIAQLEKRSQQVFSVHPEFIQQKSTICNYPVASFQTLLLQAKQFEEQYAQPSFSVYIHGDFNLDNIIYDPVQKKINFIDLHRSQYMDYIQDVAVFMVSHYRLNIIDTKQRQRIIQRALAFFYFVEQYSLSHKDDTFHIRLALALARSFFTSTRFILDKSLAKAMFIRCRYLLESLLHTPVAQLAVYTVPIEHLFSD